MSNLTDKRTERRKLGDLGEGIACQFLEKHGYKILERNYLRKWGEIDIVSLKKGIIHFIEVKSVSCVTLGSVSGETRGDFRPEDNMHPWKLKRLARTIQTYLLHPPAQTSKKREEIDWQLDLITVKMDMKTRRARVEMIENIII